MLEKGIADFVRQFGAENDFIAGEATNRVKNSLVRLSPVAEGEFVSDWDAAIGAWPSDTKPPDDPKKRTTRARLGEAIKGMRMGLAAFFENTDPVAIRLEYGYSKKAPQGVVRLTARKWRSFVRGAGIAAQKKIQKRMRDGE